MDKSPSPLASFRQSSEPKLTLEGLGIALGVNKSTVLRWERGVVPIPISRLDDVEWLTGIPRQALRPDLFKTEVAA